MQRISLHSICRAVIFENNVDRFCIHRRNTELKNLQGISLGSLNLKGVFGIYLSLSKSVNYCRFWHTTTLLDTYLDFHF